MTDEQRSDELEQSPAETEAAQAEVRDEELEDVSGGIFQRTPGIGEHVTPAHEIPRFLPFGG